MSRKSPCRIFVLPAAVAASVLVPVGAHASGTINVPCGDVAALRAAVVTANTDAEHVNTINLAASCVYTIDEPYTEGQIDGLPPITHNIDIRGHGATIQRSPAAEQLNRFRILRVDGGTVALFDTTIRNGHIHGEGTSVHGAGILNRSTLFINDASFIQNRVRGGAGGAIDNHGFLSANDVTFSNNAAFGVTGELQASGALENRPGAVAEIRWSNFLGNRAAVGGAITNSGELMIFESAFDTNSASRADGAISNRSGGDATILRSYFGLNEAWDGGAIGNRAGASLDIQNTTFRGNQAILRRSFDSVRRDGGAIHNAGALVGTHLTFSTNRAAAGAAIFNDDESGTTTLVNSIVNSTDRDCAGTITDGGDNLVWPADISCPSTFEVGDPKLVSASRNGAAQAFNLSHRLGPGSAAVDLIQIDDCVLATDQRALPRAGSGCDAGSYENQAPTAPGTPAFTVGTNPSNTGQFTLAWSPSTDADVGDTLTRKLFHQDADDLAPSLVSTTNSAPRYTFSASAPEAEGTFEYFVEASDGNLTATGAPSAPVVVDKTAPAAPSAATDRSPDFTPSGGGDGWYRDSVTVTFADPGDPLLVDGSPGSGIASVTVPQTFSTSGVHPVSGSATDRAGNASPVTDLTVQVDAEVPNVSFTSCPGDVLLGATASAVWSASDASSGLATPSGGSIPLDTSAVGTKSVTTPQASDNVGHHASATCDYRVIYDFSGFFAPVKNLPALNEVDARRIIRMSFSLAGNQGLEVFAADYPQSAPIECGSDTLVDDGVPTTVSQQGFTFAPAAGGRYTYPWKPDTSWSGTCRQFIMKLRDGTFHRANFRF